MKRQTDLCVISEKTHTGMKIHPDMLYLMYYRKMIGKLKKDIWQKI